MVKFSEDLWDALDHVVQKSEVGTQVVRDISEFLKKRAELEADYGKRLAALCKVPPGGGGFFGKPGEAPVNKDTKTIRAAIISIQEEGARIANVHVEFSNKILAEAVKPLDAFAKAKELERKKLIAEGQKRNKALIDAKAAVEKTKDSYGKAGKEADAAVEAHEKAQKDLFGEPENKKFKENEKRAVAKVQPAQDKHKAAEAAYQKAVDSANEIQGKSFSEYLPPILDGLQQYEEERFQQLRTSLGEFLKLQKFVPQAIDQSCDELAKQVDSLDLDGDTDEFVKAHASGVTEPAPFAFHNYKDPAPESSSGSGSSSSSSSSTTTSSASGKGKEKEEEKKEEKEEEKLTAEEEKVKEEEKLFEG